MNTTEGDVVPGEISMPLELLISAFQPRARKAYDFWTVFLCFFFPPMWHKHPKPPSESYLTVIANQYFSDISQLCSVCFALPWL